MHSREAVDIRRKVSRRGWAALRTVGGLAAIRESRDLLRLRAAFLNAYELQVATDTAQEARTRIPPQHQRGELERVSIKALPAGEVAYTVPDEMRGLVPVMRERPGPRRPGDGVSSSETTDQEAA